MASTTQKIRPLSETVFLYVDDSPESEAAVQLLQEANVTPLYITQGPVGPTERKPILIPGRHQGLEEIRDWLALFYHWSDTAPNSPVFKQNK